MDDDLYRVRERRSQTTQLDRIEAKLDALLAALADDPDEDDRPRLTLEGERWDGPRPPGTPL